MANLFWLVEYTKVKDRESHYNPFLPESVMETCSVVLTLKSVDEILWCDHSNETSSAVLLHCTICFSINLQNKFWYFS